MNHFDIAEKVKLKVVTMYFTSVTHTNSYTD